MAGEEEGAAAATPPPPKRVLFVCGHNAGRSIAAEAVARATRPDLVVASAGTKPGGSINPLMAAELTKRSYSLEGMFSKPLEDPTVNGLDSWDLIVTMGCMDNSCPFAPGKTVVDWGLPDPHGDASVIPEVVDRVEEHVKAL